jgi:hypothetical protein
LLDVLDAGDVTRLDGLARSTRDLLNTLAAVTAKKAGFNINQPLSRENSDGRAT